uniref:Very-long-chain (3R)-3-hydroxyacyl-CoA dehydratase n=1 Tax=Aegilops tauschii subsp. strangulata TaxID=200361 RepID=A0A452Z9X4_AEGTS
MARPSRLYLLAYNSVQAIGWSLALLRLLPCLAPPVSVRPAYAAAGDLICFLQTCAVLETVHAAVGLVPTSPFLAFLQWGGRTHFILALLRQIPEVQGSPSVFITFMAWSISEVWPQNHLLLSHLFISFLILTKTPVTTTMENDIDLLLSYVCDPLDGYVKMHCPDIMSYCSESMF